LVENAVVAQFEDAFYYRKGDEEIDLITMVDDHPLPIEIKFRNTIDEKDRKTLRDFMAKNGLRSGILLSMDEFSVSDKILTIPIYLFMALNEPLKTVNEYIESQK
jgi:predicted AAA+ superfamily ATPase